MASITRSTRFLGNGVNRLSEAISEIRQAHLAGGDPRISAQLKVLREAFYELSDLYQSKVSVQANS